MIDGNKSVRVETLKEQEETSVEAADKIAIQPSSYLAQGDRLMDVIIRPEIGDDFPAAREIVRLAFPDEDVAGLLEALRGSEEYPPELALVAVRDGEVSGHIMFTTSPSTMLASPFLP